MTSETPAKKKKAAKKAVTAKIEPAVEVQTATSTRVEEVLGRARLEGVPLLDGKCTVSLHFEIDGALTPLDAVQDVTNQVMRGGLASWTWLVRDEESGEQYAVQDGRMVSLEEARVAPE